MTAGAISRPAVSTKTTSSRTFDWRRQYAGLVAISDLIVLVWAVFGTQLVWFGLGSAELSIREDSRLSTISYWVFSAGLVVVWMLLLATFDTRGYRVIGAGTTEYKRIVGLSTRLFGGIAILAFLFRVDVARGYLLIAFPLGLAVLCLTRWLWRQWLITKRANGEWVARVLLVGSEQSVATIARELGRNSSAGYHVVGACVPSGRVADTIDGTEIPIMGSIDAVEQAMRACGADTVAVTSTDDLPADKVKQISWGLQPGREHLVLAPSIVDIAGPRLMTRPVAGLPLIHVETPRFTLGQGIVKRTVDLVLTGVGIALLSPILLLVALMVRLDSPGPILFRQTRVGLGGETFTMLKFRSMVIDAEERLQALRDQAQDAGNDVLFKMKDDPRITRVGSFIRRFSLDELPQLFNVFGGSMSLVGPRPPLVQEVELYDPHVHRRFLAKPGITGLWQVSGRSNLSWDDTVRLDLYYVENWSLTGDVAILAKTVKAVLARDGAF
ncbi:sugar transferase [Microbacterium sp.]|uniref:sugar transferase n=1 Tax=Microbacterium sp. TaxID=51671 RepID=UPI003C255529